jgi:hypothetical protein
VIGGTKRTFDRHDGSLPSNTVFVVCDWNSEPHELRRSCENPRPPKQDAAARIDVIIVLFIVALVSVLWLSIVFAR